MFDFFLSIFDTSSWPRRWDCGHWTVPQGLLHICSDLGVGTAYVAIPFVLAYFATRRKDLPFQRIFWLFVAFILACGSTHFMDAAIFYWPAYRLAGLIKLWTAIVSWATVLALVPIVPQALTLRSPKELEREINDRRRAEEALRKAQAQLEGRVAERTAELATANDQLQLEVVERQRTEHKLRDVLNDRERLLADTEAARDEANAANRLKDEFLATLSHELRTPLNAILGWAQLLQRGDRKSSDLDQGLTTIERNARVQTRIIEDLLDLSRIMSGKLRLDVQPVDLPGVIEDAIAAIAPAADARGVQLTRVLDPKAGPVSGDPARLQQVVWNLLSNAVKFTPRGGKVQVRLARINSHVEITVSDTGQGIDPGFMPHVFDRFRQFDASTTRKSGGLGLGLSIVRQIVEMHGGTVQGHSEGLGAGAVFTVKLPISATLRSADEGPRQHPTAPAEGGQDQAAAPLHGVRIVVVDDEPDAQELIRRVLAASGAIVQVAGSAKEAMQLLSASRPDVLISDIGMPDEDGYDLLRQVRQREGLRDLPSIALTAFARSEDRQRALLSGFQMHLAKPVDPVELTIVVASVAGRVPPSDEDRRWASV